MSRSPLFDLYGEQDPLEVLGVTPLRKKTLADLLPEERKVSLLRELANSGTSGLSTLGWLLDTPGAMVRGGLQGGIGKALSALWEGSDERVSGRDLLRQSDLAGQEDNWGNFTGGLATEIALDPLTYLSFGITAAAKTAAAKAARKAGLMTGDMGLLAKRGIEEGLVPAAQGAGSNWFLRNATPQTLIDLAGDAGSAERRFAERSFREVAGDAADDLLTKPLTRSNRVSVPFLYDGAKDLLGKNVGDALALGRDRLGNAITSAPVIGPVARTASALFDSRRMGLVDEADQWIGRELTEVERVAGPKADKPLSRAYVNAARNVGEETFRSPAFAEAFGNVMENQLDQVPDELLRYFQPGGEAYDLVNYARRQNARAIGRAQKKGIKLSYSDLPNDVDYFFRQAVNLDNPTYAPGFTDKSRIAYDKGTSIAGISSGEARRRSYLEAFPRWVINKMAKDGELQSQLRQMPNDPAALRSAIDTWVQREAPQFTDPFSYVWKNVDELDEAAVAAAQAAESTRYQDLADFARGLPTEFAEKKIDFFGNPLNDLSQYVRQRATDEGRADVLLGQLKKRADAIPAERVAGGTSYTLQEAAEKLGFDGEGAVKALAEQMVGGDLERLNEFSIAKEFVERLGTKIRKARTPMEAQGLLKAADKFTSSFKTLALLFPSRYTRDMYSGSFAGATQDAFGITDAIQGVRAGGGDYRGLAKHMRDAPRYQKLRRQLEANPKKLNDLRQFAKYSGATDDELIDELITRQVLTDAGGQRITSYTATDEVGRAAEGLAMRETFPGGAGGYLDNLSRDPKKFSTYNPWATRKRTGYDNPLLELGDRASAASDNFNRLGTFLNRVRKGDTPEAAKAITDLTQVNYRPEAFTAFEREVMKRVFPFYSFTKGITPLVAKELVERPAGMTGQSIRAISRASEPSEDQFVPEYLRQSAAIPISPDSPFGVKTPGVQRYLTNIDLPHESLINLFSPGVGNTASGTVMNTVMKTGQNLLGQTNPLIKGPLEYFTDRQFYSGRQLSDLYSMLEHDIGSWGRPLEQLVVNAPGGSRVLGLVRQMRDNRISTPERLAKLGFNALTGMKFQDVDKDRTVRLAARSSLNELLSQARGMSSYENLFIKDDDLRNLSPKEQEQYLLFRILQSEASKQAREKKKAAEKADPLSVLGVR
jgi:hypothetical protein